MRFVTDRFVLLFRWSVSHVLSVAAPAVAAQEAPRQPIGAFTAAQAQSGRAIYNQNCDGCHSVNFEGSGEAPSLAGDAFMREHR
jgi:mono/diheme cytochrome c family protein